MKEAAEGLKTLPTGFNTVGFQYRGYEIHLNGIINNRKRLSLTQNAQGQLFYIKTHYPAGMKLFSPNH